MAGGRNSEALTTSNKSGGGSMTKVATGVQTGEQKAFSMFPIKSTAKHAKHVFFSMFPIKSNAKHARPVFLACF